MHNICTPDGNLEYIHELRIYVILCSLHTLDSRSISKNILIFLFPYNETLSKNFCEDVFY